MDEGVASFLVHFDGTLDEQGDNHAYIGGKTRLLTLPYTSGFDELIYKIHDRIGAMPNESRIGVKCQVPIGRFLKLIMIEIEDSEDLKAVLEMFKNSTISLGMLYVTKFKPIEQTHPTSTSTPRVQNEGHSSLPQSRARDHTGQEEVPMCTIEVQNEDLVSSNVETGEDVLDDGMIRRGQSYPGLQQFKTALREHAIQNNFEYRNIYSSSTKFAAKCVNEGCSWRIHASFNNMEKFLIRTYNSKHTCSIPAESANHKQATSLWIAGKMIDTFRTQTSMNAKSIQAFMLENWHIKVSYKKAQIAKEKMLEMVNGTSMRNLVRPVGRPRSKRIQRDGPTTRCGDCKQLGHNKRTCKNPPPQPGEQPSL
ncbi:hypothetical protein L1049_003855 [Liquidambar formosana]|uniref:Transposase MuDR plant domain-containing protein n=1 Tax=Liquidambar formosana TaxID=63359 RepID=A0AAP0RMJ3_LIQFO